MNSKDFMSRAIELAKKGESWTQPNPLVGAVLVKNNKIISEGYHAKFGENHAEINAINKAGEQTKGATLYVSLEPCNKVGKTPPCVDAIISAGIKKVVYASKDPNQEDSKNVLKKAGVEVEKDFLKSKADEINKAFLYFHKNHRTYIAIKFASSLDGKLATKTHDSKWITNEQARKFTRSLRAKYQAILVGANTVVSDNPNLGVRSSELKDPLRIILDTSLKTDVNADVYRDSNVLVFCGNNASDEKIKQFQEKNIEVIKLITEKIYINKVIEILTNRNIISVLVEGGGKVIGSFIDQKLINKVYAVYAPILIGGKNAINIAGNGADNISESFKLTNVATKTFGDNVIISADTIN